MNFKIGDIVVVPHRKSIEKIEFIEEVEGTMMMYTTCRRSYAFHQVKGILEYEIES
jgi:hypothetical protein